MKRLLILLIIAPMLFTATGCATERPLDEVGGLQHKIKDEFGVEVQAPEIPDLEITNAFIYYKNDEPYYVTVQYAQKRGPINEYFRAEDHSLNEDRLKEYEQEMNSKFLLGPYEWVHTKGTSFSCLLLRKVQGARQGNKSSLMVSLSTLQKRISGIS
ncbi:hypothetical protein BEP19_02775 [Ammoniphilus oxalaticus]|uniref:DUF4367 domain-containing protein n=1 Tax=Ammoniphilus oxalaticus TaxID=66863 RepID=A0A419SNN7_9BACL|nr:hypothetical protein [Ammoniphilus oxalaticus]RKD25873.1 hypothetical protein BEP19_02775 [Ammoniphilus oxalaticus]